MMCKSIVSKMLNRYMVQPYLEYHVAFWSSHLENVIVELEKIQKQVPKMTEGVGPALSEVRSVLAHFQLLRLLAIIKIRMTAAESKRRHRKQSKTYKHMRCCVF